VSRRRWFFTLFALIFLLILGWFGWEQWQLMKRQAAAPVVSVAEDGTVRINGRVLVIGPGGLPPVVLRDEDGPRSEAERISGVYGSKSPPKAWRLGVAEVLPHAWMYPRLGMSFLVASRLKGGVWRYRGLLTAGQWAPLPDCTLEFRGRRWWLGKPGPLGALGLESFQRCLKPGDHVDARTMQWTLEEGGAQVLLVFRPQPLIPWLKSPLLTRPRLCWFHVAVPEPPATKAEP